MKLEDLKAGDVVEIDGGFDCMDAGEHTVFHHENGLYLKCRAVKHFLEGQEDFDEEGGELVGVKWPGDDWPQTKGDG